MADGTLKDSGRMIPWYFVGFFVVLAIMDGIFVYLATSTHTGVVTEEAYKKGLNYNDTVAAARTQAALGWNGTIEYTEDRRVLFTLQDASGAPLTGAQVVAEFSRPTHNKQDFSIPLQQVDAGNYAAPVEFPLIGLWDARVFVEWNQQQYQQGKRLVVN